MATATEVIANETEIKQAMKSLLLDTWTDDLLDEIELNRRLKISEEQDERGEGTPAEEVEKRIKEKFANGYFSRENAKKRIEERMARRSFGLYSS
jgi:hypothetical protein